jgi:tryptophanyl-tRNA synthetase
VNGRVVAGMRPTGRMHLGDYLGTLKTWVRLQQQHECFFFVADWHALANSYEETPAFRQRMTDMVLDWLAAGISPGLATVFVQSRVVECAELYVLLSMCTPLSWLERVAAHRAEIVAGEAGALRPAAPVDAPKSAGDTARSSTDAAATTASEAQATQAGRPRQWELSGGEPASFGQLGYPLLQACDILIYRPTHACVPEDQALHVELTRDVARRFNHLYGRERDSAGRIRRALRSLGRGAEAFLEHRRAFQERGDEHALEAGMSVLDTATSLTVGDRERLVAYIEGGGMALLHEPEMLLATSLRLPGTDGRPMARERGNTIDLRDTPEEVQEKLRRMPTDPARVRRQDPGNPENCPVWRYHVLLGDDDSKRWADKGCRSAAIGCKECKSRVADQVRAVLDPIREAALQFEESPEVVESILVEGTERARDVARDTMMEVRRAMSLEPN